ncbi:hypothetical protein [uncultured Adlercreutzia sp.]|uniref:hypothetical protein n=1 Tax=uncultured Adlercreutzia sp. TaxID=875803 RepID=UPI002675B441|nr:hypothetical protein [uncultured Adlercreutzia sp.]
MKAMTHHVTYEFSKAKKVLASMVAAALVVSFGNFAVAGTHQALADDQTVEVQFKIEAPGATVEVDGQSFTADSAATYAAATDADLAFSVDAGADSSPVTVSYATEGGQPQARAAMGSKQPSDNLIIGESSAEDDSIDASDATAESDPSAPEDATDSSEPEGAVEATHDGAMYMEQEMEVIPETAVILQDSIEDDATALASTNGDAVEEELVDEYPPMAAAPTVDDSEEEAVESITLPANEDGTYTIPMSVLSSAADRGATVVVTIVADEGVTTWAEVADVLQNGEQGTVKLAADITEGVEPVKVQGNKTLDLNGHDITAEYAELLFKVNKGVTLTITDTSENATAKELEVVDSEFNGKKIPSPADGEEARAKFEAMTGKTATYNAEDKTLQYFITKAYTDRPAKGQTEEYLFEYKLDLSGAGSIDIAEGVSIAQVYGGTLNIEGGRLTMADAAQMIIAAESATINMSGGFLVGSTGDNGAAIYSEGATVDVGGNAILAGNTASGDNNGGAIFAYNTDLSIGGNALLAGNTAGTEVLKEVKTDGFADIRLGGAVYAEGDTTVKLSDNAVLSGNVANADGGAIYLHGKGANKEAGSSTLEISDDVFITNNRALNDKTDDHQAGEKSNGGRLGGGGGIFALDAVTINNAQITSNYASDAGGGMVITYYKYGMVPPTLCVENVIVASNWAGTSEGGGIHARTSYTPLDSNPNNDSYINAGYLTNNMTSTTWDYGGGALFLEQATSNTSNPTTGMLVRYPLITGNTAHAFGGGVGVCTNGFVVTADAAIYDNTAEQANATTNPGEFGDQWAYDKDTYGLDIEDGASDDFFCARRSEVYNSMLGGGFYRWTGYTSGTITYTESYKGTISTWRDGSWPNVQTGLTLSGQEVVSPPNALFNPATKVAEIYIPDGSSDVTDFSDYYVTVEVKQRVSDTYPKGKWSGRVEKSEQVKSDVEGFSKFLLTLELTNSSDGFRKKVDFDDSPQKLVAYTNSESKQEHLIYHLTNPDTFPKTADAVLQSDRFTALKADPLPDDKDAALAKAVLFVTGNYSNTNGGGIGCNDRIAIGRDPGSPEDPGESTEPEDPKKLIGALQINKTLNEFSAESGTATALFKVTGYTDRHTAVNRIPEFVIYENTVGFTFGAGENMNASELLEGLPAGWYVIEEQYYSGDNFDGTPNRSLVEVKGVEEGSEVETAVVEVSFDNTYVDESYGTGAVNRYASGENGFTYTPIRPSTEEGR